MAVLRFLVPLMNRVRFASYKLNCINLFVCLFDLFLFISLFCITTLVRFFKSDTEKYHKQACL